MKKLFLFALLASFVGIAQAQQTVVRAPEQVRPQLISNEQMEGPSIFREFMVPQDQMGSTRATKNANGLKKTTEQNELFEIGKMANTYGMIGDQRQQIACDPKTGRVAVIFRGNDRGTSDGNTLYIRYSEDNGDSWGAQGDNVSNTTGPRYPNIIMSPTTPGNTAVTAFWAQTAQYNDGNSGFGAVPGMSSGIGNSNPLYSTFPTPPLWSIPFEPFLNQITGDVYSVALALDPANGASTGELYLLKSTDKGASWTADLSNPVYTEDIVPTGYFDSNLRFDISPDGNTMIMAFSLIIESEPGRAYLVDPNHEIAWRVSNDLGKTWGPIQRVKPSEIQNKPRPFDFACNMSWDFDMTIDNKNRPHFLTVLSADVNPFGLDRPTDSTIALNSTDSTFVCEVVDEGKGFRIYPIGPARRLRTDRLSFTASSTTFAAYVFRNEVKWARTWDGDKVFAKWISPFYTWRVGLVAGAPTLFADTLTQVYVNGRHVDSRGGNPYKHPWDFVIPDNNSFQADSVMRYTATFEPFVGEFDVFGAKFTKVAKYASDNGHVHVIFPEWGVGETRDDDAVFSDQTVWYVKSVQIDNIPIMVNVEQIDAIPGNLSLQQNYPNPFNPSTEISFTLPTAAQTTLRVFNVLGQNVATLASEYLTAGTHKVSFNAGSLPSGVYMYRLESGNLSVSKKMMLNK